MLKRIKVPELQTERLILRRWNRKDSYDLFEYAKDPAVGPAAGWPPHEDLGRSMFIIDNHYRKCIAWALEEKSSGKVIGSIMLDEDKYRQGIDSREIGYSLARSRWGKGYMPEAANRIIRYAFEVLHMDALMLRIAEDNKQSQRVAEKCGFTYEGTIRHSYRNYDGTIRAVRCYSILKEEFQTGKHEE